MKVKDVGSFLKDFGFVISLNIVDKNSRQEFLAKHKSLVEEMLKKFNITDTKYLKKYNNEEIGPEAEKRFEELRKFIFP